MPGRGVARSQKVVFFLLMVTSCPSLEREQAEDRDENPVPNMEITSDIILQSYEKQKYERFNDWRLDMEIPLCDVSWLIAA